MSVLRKAPETGPFAGVVRRWLEPRDFGNRLIVGDGVSPLILLAAVSNLLVQEIERSEYQHLATDHFKTDLRAFAARVEDELEAQANRRRRLHLAEDGGSAVSDD